MRKLIEKAKKNIEAVAISSYDCKKKEVESRFVNLKFVDDGSFIFLATINHQNHLLLNPIIKLVPYYIGILLIFR